MTKYIGPHRANRICRLRVAAGVEHVVVDATRWWDPNALLSDLDKVEAAVRACAKTSRPCMMFPKGRAFAAADMAVETGMTYEKARRLIEEVWCGRGCSYPTTCKFLYSRWSR